jgi:hypothetical protein
MKRIKYIIIKSLEGEIDGLSRLVEDGKDIVGADYYNGAWHENEAVWRSYWQEPGLDEFLYDESEAARIMKFLDERDGIK